jgi:hypothetical protein
VHSLPVPVCSCLPVWLCGCRYVSEHIYACQQQPKENTFCSLIVCACPPVYACVCCCVPARYVSEHTVAFWAASYVQDLARSTRSHVAMKCYGLGLGLDTFRWVGGGGLAAE